MCAYFIGKMVEIASSTRKRIQFHSFSTLLYGFRRKNLSEQTFSERDSTHLP
jgi:hypothetical protein